MAVSYLLRLPENQVRDAQEANARIRELANACREIISDGVISPEELNALHRWVFNAGQILRYWPANAIAARLRHAIESDSDADRSELFKLLKEIAGGYSLEDPSERESVFTELDSPLRFEGKTFVLSGIFYYGTRAQCEKAVTDRGGLVRQAVARSTNYVIVGGIANPRWLHAESGTKIEDALMHQRYRDEEIASARGKYKAGPAPAIIRERDWVNAITRGPMPGFAFCVPAAFENAINHHDLHTGDIFYDSPEGYHEWSIALQRVNTCISILEASSGPAGAVRFAISTPDDSRTQLVRRSTHTVSQADVIALLRNGVTPTEFSLSSISELVPRTAVDSVTPVSRARSQDEITIAPTVASPVY